MDTGQGYTISPNLWVRQFLRTAEPDIDIIAKQEFITEHFTDFFGKWLQVENNRHNVTFDSVATTFDTDTGKYAHKIFAVADGLSIKGKGQAWRPWMNNHMRFVMVVYPANEVPFQSWNFLMVGSKDVKNESAFLQVASWDISHGRNEFKFYQRDQIQPNGKVSKELGWIYHGRSSDAFDTVTNYLGVFSRHINGTVIMKELHYPWYHWFSPHTNLEAMKGCLTDGEEEELRRILYISKGNQLFASITSAEELERIIAAGISKTFLQRATNDFKHSSATLVKMKRWMAYFLLTTTINIQTASKVPNEPNLYYAPLNHFLNTGLHSQLVSFNSPKYTFSLDDYERARKDLDLVVIQDYRQPSNDSLHDFRGYRTVKLPKGTLGGGKQTNKLTQQDFVIVHDGKEMEFPFVVLEASYEDLQGVIQARTHSLLTQLTASAIHMLDFCNPVYSWRRGVLMQYVPETKTWDINAMFVQNIRNSQYANETKSPEHELLEILKQYPTLDEMQKELQKRVSDYLEHVNNRLKTQMGLYDYLRLAESRKRIYRPLPLNEHAGTLPYACKFTDAKLLEMTPDGTVRAMAPRGAEFFRRWTKSLSGYDPYVIPPEPEDKYDDSTSATLPPPCVVSTNPTWDDNIMKFFSEPYWLSPEKRKDVGNGWIRAMKYWSGRCALDNYAKVKELGTARSIYHHLRTRSMPLTEDHAHYFPEYALEEFRTWANQGFRKTLQDDIKLSEVIPKPIEVHSTYLVRRDITTLTRGELQNYQAALDDILGARKQDSIWQELGLLHAEWCLHYQEATFPWHRAYLAYVESLIRLPIPYWNGFAAEAANPDSPFSGIPAVFLEEDYTHPISGESRPNPLKYALALGGQRSVTRDPVLVVGRGHKDYTDRVKYFAKYQKQINSALKKALFSTPQGKGKPWANLDHFTPDMPDGPYIYRDLNFDGAFEQPHDNFHGWVGPDMANNSYASCDPVFLSLHANLDRIFAAWLDAHPHTVFSSNFAVRPFIGARADSLRYTETRQHMFTTLGDMVKSTRVLGYEYGPPASPDYVELGNLERKASLLVKPVVACAARGGCPMATAKAEVSREKDSVQETILVPCVIFEDVTCTKDSYRVDVFVAGDGGGMEHSRHIGSVTFLGMGPAGTDNGRCGAPEQRTWRMLDATGAGEKFSPIRWCEGQDPRQLPQLSIVQTVTDLAMGEKVDESIWKSWKGFEGRCVWMLKESP